MNLRVQNNNAGLYVHIPFCVKKCPYCDFYSVTDLSLRPRFIKALIAEMQTNSAEGLLFDTLYIGGGTPSVCDGNDIGQIVTAARRNFDFLPDSEMTIEVNPGTVSIGQLEDYRHAGINRLNIGVQSFNQGNLDFLGRIHTADEARKAITDAYRAGFAEMGLDLIYGLPDQSAADWLEDLKQAVDHNPAHLSCYMLTYEKGTPLHGDNQNNRIDPLADDRVRDLFLATIEFLEGNGYWQYEISNFACQAKDRAIHISRHNLKYWTRAPYFGLGPSAHSFVNSERHWNHPELERYLAAVESRQTAIAEREELSIEQEMIEVIYLGLRMTRGIELVGFEQKFRINFVQSFKDVLNDLENRNFLVVGATHAALTRRGRVFLDSIAARFIEADVLAAGAGI